MERATLSEEVKTICAQNYPGCRCPLAEICLRHVFVGAEAIDAQTKALNDAARKHLESN